MKYEDSDFSNDSDSQLSATTATADSIVNSNGVLLHATSFIALEGLNSGVPTRTTPTLTPTTLRNIEQTFIELQSETESHENEAGFVPPLVHSIGNNQYIPASEADIYSTKSNSSLWHSSLSQSSSDSNQTRPTPPVTPTGLAGAAPTPQKPRRNMGGRKPAKDVNISPEEEERRRVRRERNKLAAARCRKRRVDHTNALIEETEGLEQKKQALQTELQDLHSLREDLEYMLEAHKSNGQCLLGDRDTPLLQAAKQPRPASPPDVKPFTLLPPFNNNNNHPDKNTQRVKTEIIDPLPPQSACYSTDTSTTTNHSAALLFNGGTTTTTTTNALLRHAHKRARATPKQQQDENDGEELHFSHPPTPIKKLMLNPEICVTPTSPLTTPTSLVAPSKPSRPNTLNVANGKTIAELTGIAIQTPSSGIQFNFDSLMVGGTGLTPVSAPLVPNCAQQQRIPSGGGADLTSPDSRTPPKLVSL